MAQVLIFGAGKIARGFLGHLLYRAGVDMAFVEQAPQLVTLLTESGRYRVSVLGNPEKSDVVSGFRVYAPDDRAGIQREMADATTLFTAVGGKNLPAIAPAIGYALSVAGRPVNVITCENWTKPAQQLERAVRELYPNVQAGFAEAVVMRSAIEPDPQELAEDPLLVNVQDYWHLPVDAAGLIAPLPPVKELELIENFGGFLEQKFYTYNAANGTVSYLGALLSHERISDAAWDDRILSILDMVYLETGQALARKYGMPLQEQLAFAATSKTKLQDRVIVDNVERNARDPLRKLGPQDRLVGSARLCERHGVEPVGLATAIAAALHYTNEDDPSAVRLQQMMAASGAAGVLETVCDITPGEPLQQLVLEREQWLKEQQWMHS